MDSNNNPSSQSQSYFSLLNFPYDRFSPSVNFSSSQTQTPFLSPQPSSQPSQPPSQPEETPEERRERRIWSTQDDLVLISDWLNTSKDSIVGNDQRAGCFWKRIGDYYASSTHVLDGAEPRNHEHCRQRWQKISREVSRFRGTYADAKSEKASGMNDLDILQNAHQLFTLLYKKKFGMIFEGYSFMGNNGVFPGWLEASTVCIGNGRIAQPLGKECIHEVPKNQQFICSRPDLSRLTDICKFVHGRVYHLLCPFHCGVLKNFVNFQFFFVENYKIISNTRFK
ncbi:hypothetical protein Bca52824_068410 [Brassica carinata]|uniref:Myb-like domain-containing protein n=1 Tax=Brassica carinata TaxID=52824 RepID=A0A8X7U1X6_BRACI|nr:hypothetical protein Bca52824_068410 [Brassica carinata]